jgi:cephalosporin-C deacetylase-like acetyl esterase
VSPDRVLPRKPANMMLDYFQRLAADLPPERPLPRTREGWEARRTELRRRIWQSLGSFPLENRPPVQAKLTGRLDHGDHVVEKLIYESLSGLWVTALLFLPQKRETPAPTVLYLNGHWPEAKHTPLIQRCCMGLARQGVIAFCQDVIGTGERGAKASRPHPTYHGKYRGAAPWIVGRSLLGTIIYECLRAVDYLVSRPEVDPKRIMCTGASGGGKQSMFLAALDDRIAGAVPVCYLASYQAHIGASACVGEVPPGVLTYTNQWEILGMHAPRPLLGIAATEDIWWFAPGLMHETLALTRERVYALYGDEAAVRGVKVESRHDYNQPMRELLYNHVACHLQGVREPRIVEPDDLPVETAAALRCGLPRESETLQSLTCRQAREMVAAIPVPRNLEEWRVEKERRLTLLEHDILGGFPDRSHARSSRIRESTWEGHRIQHWILETEPGVLVPLVLCFPGAEDDGAPRPAALVVDESGKRRAFARGLIRTLVEAGTIVAAMDYRGAGETAGTVPAYGGVPDYNLTNYSLFLDRPLAGMRAHDIRCSLDVVTALPSVDLRRIALIGRGMGAFAGVVAAALDERIGALAAEELLATWVFPREFSRIGLSYLIPGILKVGDVGHLAACVAPRPLLLLNGVDGRRRPVDHQPWKEATRFTDTVYGLHGRSDSLCRTRVTCDEVPQLVADWLRHL